MKSTPNHQLTKREREVLVLIAEGHSSKKIAQQMGITFKTAVCHRQRLMAKLNAHSIAGLIRTAVHVGLVDLGSPPNAASPSPVSHPPILELNHLALSRIVVLDPEPTVRAAIARMLRHYGYTVLETHTVEAAVEAVQAAPTALLLSRVSLPGTPASGTVRLLRDACPEVPVLVISGLPDDPLVREAAGLQGIDIFPEPFRAEDLFLRVRDSLDVVTPAPSVETDTGASAAGL